MSSFFKNGSVKLELVLVLTDLIFYEFLNIIFEIHFIFV
ncbi:conserved hypothetical protein [Leptospira interrogans serovar Manilae]|uniref:Uncharacterized protein n=1 Tax=Leptospira interrogans serovar Manilae TaxID=214675 RepID=A0AAQ1NZZ0_LEPIR|nr:hypothetical protein LEP1GSC013_1064 [Leptospira interrogans serovar Valbuzzi str. Duyster]ENO71994.1 hypothetical protein LEP1GSC012_2294 [Leptospira interrogans serovar Valbuzzi str. Valbuzzi]SOR62854.1 conserved hypothetical protein [Leptospira interrogans serovar Manilae]